MAIKQDVYNSAFQYLKTRQFEEVDFWNLCFEFLFIFLLQLAEDLRERWETSDSPVVHKIQEYVPFTVWKFWPNIVTSDSFLPQSKV